MMPVVKIYKKSGYTNNLKNSTVFTILNVDQYPRVVFPNLWSADPQRSASNSKGVRGIVYFQGSDALV
jgi:hypothetical protein